jgi:hypothetical protein
MDVSTAFGSRDSSVTTAYGLDGPGSIRSSARFVFSPQRPDRLRGPMGTVGPFLGGKKGHSPPPSAEIKNGELHLQSMF